MTDNPMNVFVYDLDGKQVANNPDDRDEYDDQECVLLSEDRGRWTAEFTQFYGRDGEMVLTIVPPRRVTADEMFQAFMSAFKSFAFE